MLTSYLLVTGIVFGLWLSNFLRDQTTPKTDHISWLALLIGPWLWPIVLPISVTEMLEHQKLHKTYS
jgi:hypothetical protein